jgi:hypothetical protein
MSFMISTPPSPPQGVPPPAAAAAAGAAGVTNAANAATTASAAASSGTPAPAIPPPPPVADANANAFLDLTNAQPGDASLQERVTAAARRVMYATIKNWEGTVTNAELGEQIAYLTAISYTCAVVTNQMTTGHHQAQLMQQQLMQLMTQLSSQIANLQTDVTNLRAEMANLRAEMANLQTDMANLQTDMANILTQAQFQTQLSVTVHRIQQAIRNESVTRDWNSAARTFNARVSIPTHSIVSLRASNGPNVHAQPNPFPATYGDYTSLTRAQKTVLLGFYGLVFQSATPAQEDDMLRTFLGLPRL